MPSKPPKEYDDYPVLVGLPAPRNADGQIPLDQDGHPQVADWIRVASAASFGIARQLAYTIAQRGIPTSWPKQENLQDLPDRAGWLDSSVRTARTLSERRSLEIVSEAAADRAIIAARESRERGRIGNIVGELRSTAEGAANPQFRQLVNRAVIYLSSAMATQIIPDDPTTYGYTWDRGYAEKLRAAQDAWQEDGAQDDGACPECGMVHNDDEHMVMIGEWGDPVEAMLATHDPKVPQA
jgi:hypothetical protein